jgi:hypothetical protein
MDGHGNGAKAHSFAFGRAAVVFVAFECLVGLQALLAYQDHFLTVAQMQQRGVAQGLPFLWHFAMWSDLAIISPLAAYLVGKYGRRWSPLTMLMSLGIGLVLSASLHWLYLQSAMPETHVQNYALTPAGWVHAIYMGVAVGLFIQFFFFTDDVVQRVLGIVSVLVLIHVFIGNHMLLGLINLAFPQDWYPARPLKSIIGWSTVAAVALGLGLRYFASFSKAAGYFLIEMAFVVFEFLTGDNPRTTEGYLKFLDYVCGIALASTYFVKKVFWWELREGPDWGPLILFSFIALKYLLSRISVKQELAIGRSLFPPDRIPDDLRMEDRASIAKQVVGFMILYAVLGFVSDKIVLASLIMTGIACGDFRTRDLINENMRRIFADENYAPHPGEGNYETIFRRRDVARWYLFALPHLSKELACIEGCAAAFGIALYGYVNDTDLNLPAYAVLIGTQVLNEAITIWWRIDRFLRLNAIKKDETNVHFDT